MSEFTPITVGPPFCTFRENNVNIYDDDLGMVSDVEKDPLMMTPICVSNVKGSFSHYVLFKDVRNSMAKDMIKIEMTQSQANFMFPALMAT